MAEGGVMGHVQEALDLANTATALDTAGNFAGAYGETHIELMHRTAVSALVHQLSRIPTYTVLLLFPDYYDLTILSLNEALQEVPESSKQGEVILRLRGMYDERMRLLNDSSKYDIGGLMASVDLGGGGGSGGGERAPESEGGGGSARKAARQKTHKKNRRASRIPFAYEADASWNDVEKPPTMLVVQPYWQLRVISSTIRTGGFITPTIHVPKSAWSLPGSKLGGIGAKTNALEHVNMVVDQFIAPLGLKNDLKNLEKALLAFNSAEHELALLQNTLHKSFPFVPEVPVPNSEPEPESPPHTIFGRLGSIGKSVRKMAETGYSRLGAMQARVSEDDMHSYANLVASVCDRAQLFVVWYDFCNAQRDELLRPDSGAISADASTAISVLENLLMAQINVSTFMREVLCELMLRDLEMLLVRHMTKMRKSFSRMYWSDDEADDD
jgi:hypothetical protein